MATLFTGVMAAVKGASLSQVLALGGSAVSAAGSIQAGKAQAATAEFQAKQLEAQGRAERAAASLEASEEDRQKRLVMSRARAVAATSGGGQDINLLGEIEEEGTLRALNATWEGEEAAKGRKAQAAASRFEGGQYKRAGFLNATKTLLGGGASFYEKYGT